MTTLDEDKLLNPRSYPNVIEQLREDVRVLKSSQPMYVESLDSITPVAGNLVGTTLWIVDGESGLVRGIITAEPREETGDFYQVFYNEFGDITFGVDADDGSLFAAMGAVLLNESGITAIAGYIGGWAIEEFQLWSAPDDKGIILDAAARTISIGDFVEGWSVLDGFNQRFYSSNFTTGVSGFNIDLDTGDMEVNNIVARGELKSFLFTSQNQMAVAGNIVVSKDAGKLLADAASTDTSVNFGKAMTPGNWIKIQAPDATGVAATEWMLVGTLVSGTRYNVTRDVDGSGANDWLADTPFVVIGGVGDSRIELVAGASGSLQLITQGATWNSGTVQASMSTVEGAITAGAGSIRLRNSGINIFESASGGSYINFYNNAGTTELYGMYTYLNNLWFVSRNQGQGFTWNIKLTDTTTPFVRWVESPVNIAQFIVNGGATATLLNVGSDVYIQANRAGQITEFNRSKINTDFYVWGQGGTEPVAWVDASMQRFAVGYNHFFGMSTATDPNVYLNETNADIDFYYRGTTDDELIHGNAALQSVGFGGDGESGYKVRVVGSQRITGGLRAASVINDTGFAYGTYTPTRTNIQNITSSTIPAPWKYVRLGDMVIASGQIAVQHDGTGDGQIGITLPIASDLAVAQDLNGNATTASASGGSANVTGDATNNRAQVNIDQAIGTANAQWKVFFMYEVK